MALSNSDNGSNQVLKGIKFTSEFISDSAGNFYNIDVSFRFFDLKITKNKLKFK